MWMYTQRLSPGTRYQILHMHLLKKMIPWPICMTVHGIPCYISPIYRGYHRDRDPKAIHQHPHWLTLPDHVLLSDAHQALEAATDVARKQYLRWLRSQGHSCRLGVGALRNFHVPDLQRCSSWTRHALELREINQDGLVEREANWKYAPRWKRKA